MGGIYAKCIYLHVASYMYDVLRKLVLIERTSIVLLQLITTTEELYNVCMYIAYRGTYTKCV